MSLKATTRRAECRTPQEVCSDKGFDFAPAHGCADLKMAEHRIAIKYNN
jgi:hypothetical protein